MAKKTVNIGSSANDGTGDQLRSAFDKLNQNNDEIYGTNFVTEDMLNDNIVGADELKVSNVGAAGQILQYNADGTMTWATGVAGDVTGVDAGDGLTGGGIAGDVTLTVGAGTGITVAADAVSLASTVQDEITLNTAKTGITTAQAADIVTNNGKATDQTVVLTEGANVTITGTYPSFTIASDDVVGAVNSVNGDTGVVVLDTADIAEDTNLYYTEARVTANTAVAANTAKTGITTAQAADIVTNNGKATDQTVTLTDAGNITIGGTYPDFTIASADVVGAVTSVNGAAGVVVLDTADITEDTNLYYTEARVAANSAVALNTAKTGITTAQAGEITANNSKVSNKTHTGEVTGDEALTITDLAVTTGKIANEAVDATKLDVSNTGAAGQVLQYNADGTMTWVTGVAGDITGVTAGDGLTGGGTGGDVTLTVVGGAGITASADEISLSANVAGSGITYVNGVLNVNTIGTDGIVNDAIDGTKLAQFDDTLSAATTGHILVSNGTDFIQAAMSGDATIIAGGAITIADNAIDTDKILNDAVTADKLADSINTDIATGVGKTSFPGFGTSSTTALVGDTALLQLGNSSTTALAGDTALLALGNSGTTALAGDTALLALGTSGTTALAGNTALLVLGNSNTTALAGNTTVITSTQAGHITANNDKLTNATHDGEVTGAGTLTIADGAVVADRLASNAVTTIKILDNAVDAAKLNVSGNGASGQVLASDGDGSMTWTASGGGYSAIYASSAITSWTDKAVYVFTNTAALTHTLPSSPSVGTSFKMSLRSTHVNTLARNGSSIMGLAEDLVLDDLTSSFEFFFAGGAQGWVIIGAN